jgi:uncharacterized damage-inducible protein DinB
MNHPVRFLLAAACGAALLATSPSFASEAPAVPGIRGEVIASLQDASQKIVELAGAVPARKWAWRPSKGVRSVGEAYLHVAQANYVMCTFLGAKPPLSMAVLSKMDTTPTTNERTLGLLKESFAFAEKTIAELPETELAGTADFFGHPMTKQAILLAMATHAHEHLGQSIAYARTCGVVPPWTAREQAATKQQAAAKPAAGAHGHTH